MLAALVGGFAPACSSEDPKPPGQLMLVLKTDMDVPKDVSAVRLMILAGGIPRWDVTYEVGPTGTRLPGTFAIIAGDDPSLPVTVRVLAYRGVEPKVLREAIVTVPSDRIATLPMPISWLCWEQTQELPKEVGEDRPNAETTCTPGDTCSAGMCVAGEINSDDLPTYSPSQVFGGAGEPGALGTCFDTLACFADGVLAAVDLADCTIAAPAPGAGAANVALLLQPGGQGICNGSTCLIPLDADPVEGWSEASAGRLKLPPAVCDEILAGDVLGVATSNGCAQKTPAIPTCGPWSSVTSLPGTFDAGAAFDAPDPCFRTFGDDGLHCGSVLDADPGTLFTCAGGVTTGTTPCPGGCSPNDGGDDACDGDASLDAPSDALTQKLGAACTGSVECGAGQICVQQMSGLFGGEGPPLGLCTVECTGDSSQCDGLGINAVCVDFGAQDYCLLSCTIGTPGHDDCGGRTELACAAVSAVLDGGAVGAQACRPVCSTDQDCPGQRCNLATGLCTSAPPGTGGPIGTWCSDPDAGSSVCGQGACQGFPDSTGGTVFVCSGACILGAPTGCGWDGVPPQDGGSTGPVCLLPSQPNATNGDLGQCTNLCNDACNDCPPEFACEFFLNPALEAQYGALGVCKPLPLTDAGLPC